LIVLGMTLNYSRNFFFSFGIFDQIFDVVVLPYHLRGIGAQVN